MPKRRRILGPLTNKRQDSQSGFSDSKLVASPWVDQAQTNERLNHTSEGQFVNWQFYNRRGNCQAASKRVPGGQHFLIPNKKVQKAAGRHWRPKPLSRPSCTPALADTPGSTDPRRRELGFSSGLGSCPILCLCPSPPLFGLQPSVVKQGGWEVMAEDPPGFCLLGVQVPIHLCLVPHPTFPSVFRSRVRCLVLGFFFYITYSTITLLLFKWQQQNRLCFDIGRENVVCIYESLISFRHHLFSRTGEEVGPPGQFQLEEGAVFPSTPPCLSWALAVGRPSLVINSRGTWAKREIAVPWKARRQDAWLRTMALRVSSMCSEG